MDLLAGTVVGCDGSVVIAAAPLLYPFRLFRLGRFHARRRVFGRFFRRRCITRYHTRRFTSTAASRMSAFFGCSGIQLRCIGIGRLADGHRSVFCHFYSSFAGLGFRIAERCAIVFKRIRNLLILDNACCHLHCPVCQNNCFPLIQTTPLTISRRRVQKYCLSRLPSRSAVLCSFRYSFSTAICCQPVCTCPFRM